MAADPRPQRPRGLPLLALAALAILSPCAPRAAADLLSPASLPFTRASAGSGNTAANRVSALVNPAAAAWRKLPSEFGLTLAPYYSTVCFEEGTKVQVAGQALRWDAGAWGTFQPTFTIVRSNRATTTAGLELELAANVYQLIWAKRFGEWAMGAGFSFAEGTAYYRSAGSIVSEGHGEGYGFRFGALYEPAENWLVGLAASYAFAPYRAASYVVTPFGPLTTRSETTIHSAVVRPAVSYRYADRSFVHADYEYSLSCFSGASTNTHRFFLGVAHALLDCLAVRGGAVLDHRGNVGWSCAVGVQAAKLCYLVLVYKYDVHPSLEPALGKSHTVQALVSVSF
jgi:hypothetical protein